MKTTNKIVFVFIILHFWALPIYSQYNEYKLPKNSLISGLAFYTYNQGIITTEDTTFYQISFNENNEIQIDEFFLTNLNDYLFVVLYFSCLDNLSFI